ncbi:MAG: diguanylate cyclase [Candidatus Cloacimonadota bacterium]|nr:MAG: diguanylate cyclase [Candidatus Cloacimonadota bacterium]
MKKNSVFNEIINLLDENEKAQEWLLEKIKAIMKRDGNAVFSELLKVFTHLEMEPKEAEKVWKDIIKHRTDMSKSMGRKVGLRVAMLDYFISVNKQMKNPKIIEIEIFEKLEKSIITDELTGLYNKRFFIEALYREVQRAKRYGLDLSVMFVDIDDFKKCNELKGHTFGDKVLKKVAELIKQALREVDYPCRFGGDEFVAILPETRGSKALIAADRLRMSVSKVNFLRKEKYYLTVSAGVASFGIDGNTPEELVENADTALFRAKNDGKNRAYIFYKEKRKFVRMATDWDISYRVIDEAAVKTAKMKNVGGGGLLFEDEKPIMISSILDLTFISPFKRKKISAQAKVVRLEVKEDGKFDVGIFFTRIKPEDQKLIIKYTKQP